MLIRLGASFELGGRRELREGGVVAEERNAAVLELRSLLLESESESVVGGGEMVYSHRRRQGKSERDAFARCAPRPYPLAKYSTPQPPTLVIALEGGPPQ
jgi:hypothetical protein